MNPSIRNMNWTTGQMEQIREAADAAREFKRKVRRETEELVEKICAFFPSTDAGDAAYTAWVDAGPDDNAGFLEYCRAEWQAICAEKEKAHKLVESMVTE